MIRLDENVSQSGSDVNKRLDKFNNRLGMVEQYQKSTLKSISSIPELENMIKQLRTTKVSRDEFMLFEDELKEEYARLDNFDALKASHETHTFENR